jgi:3-methylcrotonyl-CoA carboxylase alpha subunit
LSGWRLNAPGTDLSVFYVGEEEYRVPVRYEAGGYFLTLPSGTVHASGRLLDGDALIATVANRQLHAEIVRNGDTLEVFVDGRQLRVRCEDRDRPGARDVSVSGLLLAPMPGRVIEVLVGPGSSVEKGQALMVIEAMKMEHTIRAPGGGTILTVDYAQGDLVDEGVELLTLAPPESN